MPFLGTTRRKKERDCTTGVCSYNVQDIKSKLNLPPGPDLDILLIGKLGHGKSATANSILGEELFVTDSVQEFQKAMDGRKLRVVDTPGLSNTDFLDEEQSRKKAEKDIRLAISLSPEGYHAILIVLRYGVRMTSEEMGVIKEIKQLLGDFMKDHGILLFTCGDSFESNMKGRKTFKTWCEEQKGFMQEMLQDCQHRCLLFNNIGGESTLKQQRSDLVQMIDGMKSNKLYKRDISKISVESCNDAVESVAQNSWFDLFQYFLFFTFAMFYRIPLFFKSRILRRL